MKAYIDLLRELRHNSEYRPDRTGVGTAGKFGHYIKHEMHCGHNFPLLTTKKIPLKLVFEELMWFLRGETNIRSLQAKGCHIWDEWADENGDLGPVYGKQWRDFGGVDQIANLLNGLRSDPYGRRHVVSAWNPTEQRDMALPPCHNFFQVHRDTWGKLSLQFNMRSCDCFLGLPFNLASYGLLLLILAKATNRVAWTLSASLGDVHLYRNHFNQASIQLKRKPTKLPTVHIRKDLSKMSIDDIVHDLQWSDIHVDGYTPQDHIKAPVAV